MIQKLLELGYNCLPLRPKSKFPALSAGYSTIEYCLNGIKQEEAEEWDISFPLKNGFNLGMFCGKASGVTWVDIDSDDPMIPGLFPDTPLIKRGKTGQSRAYRYNPNLKNKTRIGLDNGVKNFVEILNDGAYTVLPPSIHPDTNEPYKWIGDEQSLEYVNPKDLPEITNEDLEKVTDYYNKKYGQQIASSANTKSDLEGIYPAVMENGKLRCAHGAQDRIVRKATFFVVEQYPFEKAVRDLVEYDKIHHTILSYFEDKSRGADSAGDPESGAGKIITNILHGMNKSRARQNLSPFKMFYESKPMAQALKEIKLAPRAIEIKMPEPRGMLTDYINVCLKYTPNDNSEIGFAYGMGWGSMLLANRRAVKYKQTFWPANIISFVVASSGMGKNKPRKFLEELLKDAYCLGSSEYTSAVALLREFTPVFKTKKGSEQEVAKYPKRELCMSVDEVDGLLSSMSKGKDSFEKRFKKIIIEVYDASRDQFLGQISKNGGVEGHVLNPYFTLIGSTQPTYFKQAMQGDIIHKGIYQRAFIFELNKMSAGNYDKEPDLKLEQKLKDFTVDWFSYNKVEINNLGHTIIDGYQNNYPIHYREIRLTPEAENKLKLIEKEFYDMRLKAFNSDNELEASIMARLFDKTIKAAQIDWVMTDKEFLDSDCLDWGRALALANYEQSKAFFDSSRNSENKTEQDLQRLAAFIKKKGVVSAKDIIHSKVVGGLKEYRQKLLAELDDRKIISTKIDNTKTKPKTFYEYLSE